MEPASRTIVRYIATAKVINVARLDGYWFIHFEGSKEAIAIGVDTEPQPFSFGDRVKITFEKVSP